MKRLRVHKESEVPSYSEARYVDIGEIKTAYSGEFIKISSLGSCIGLVIYPKMNRISKRCAIMGHIMLPHTPENYYDKKKKKSTNTRYGPAKYADRAIPEMISRLEKLGYNPKTFVAKMVGGAKMFSHLSSTLHIGKNNTKTVKKLLKSNNIPLERHYTGGDTGMSAFFSVSEYLLIVTPTGGSPIVL